MAENYYKHYGLDQNPYPVDRVDEHFFITPEIQHRVELIKHLVEFSDRFLVVTGQYGSGKTSLIQYLMGNLAENWKVSQLRVSSIRNSDEFFQDVFNKQDLEYKPMEPLARKQAVLQEHFKKLQENHFIPVLIIDDGHLLSIELLKLLLDLVVPETAGMGNAATLRVAFFSETDLSELVSHKNMTYIHAVDIPPLTEDQCLEYMKFRFKSVGGEIENFSISEKMSQQIFRTSDGIPGLINDLAEKAMSDPAIVGEEKKSGLPDIKKYLFSARYTIPAALVLTACFLVYILQSSTDEDKAAVTRTELTIPNIEKVSKIEPEQQLQADTVANSIENTSVYPEEVEQVVLTIPEEKEWEEPKPLSDVDVSSTIVKQAENTAAANTPIEKAETIKPTERVDINVKLEQSEPLDSAPALIPQSAITNNSQETVEAPVRIVEKVTDQQVAEIPASTKPGSAESSRSSQIRGRTWLKKQSPNYYVLQLMGAHDESVLNKLMARYPSIRSDIARFNTVNQNKKWHVLVYGLYENREQAVAATVALPSGLRVLKPWPRRLDSIQKDLQ